MTGVLYVRYDPPTENSHREGGGSTRPQLPNLPTVPHSVLPREVGVTGRRDTRVGRVYQRSQGHLYQSRGCGVRVWGVGVGCGSGVWN